MNSPDMRAQALQPWLTLLAACEEQHRAAGTGPGAGPDAGPGALLARARRVLEALASGDTAPVPAWVEASEQMLDAEGRVRDLRPARALREMWCDRDAVLRLGVWGVLQALLQERGTGSDGAVFVALLAAISRHADPLSLGLQPSERHGGATQGFARSAGAAAFFNGRLKTTLGNLAALYDGQGADFARWARLPDYEPRQSPLEPWSQAWTVAVVATYVDWLHRASGGSLAAALDLVWADQPKRFRPPSPVLRPPAGAARGTPRPAVLPTDDKQMHLELRVPLVLAQVLDHQPERWTARRAGVRRFAVALAIKSIDQGDTRRRDARLDDYRNFTIYRGLSIVQLYMATAIDRLCQMQRCLPAEEAL